jgi:hypothetical protein
VKSVILVMGVSVLAKEKKKHFMSIWSNTIHTKKIFGYYIIDLYTEIIYSSMHVTMDKVFLQTGLKEFLPTSSIKVTCVYFFNNM